MTAPNISDLAGSAAGLPRLTGSLPGQLIFTVDNTSGATATAEDIADGKTAYVNGEKVTGTVPEKAKLVKYDAAAKKILVISSSSDGSHDTSRDGEYIAISSTLDDSDGKAIVSPGTELSQRLRPAEFGDAAAEDVAAGKTFTSAAGLKVTGTHECSGGIDTSDATATAEDMAQGVTAYVNGEKVTGTVPEITELVKDAPAVAFSNGGEITKKLVSSGTKPSDCSTTKYASYTVTEDGFFQLSGSTTSTLQWFSYVTGQTTNAKSIYRANFSDASTKYYLWTLGEIESSVTFRSELDETDGKAILQPGAAILQRADPSVFGDAAASDVAAGKTFTSAAGLKVTGTHECTGGIDTSDATAAAADIAEGKTAYVNGQKVTGTVPEKAELVKYDAAAKKILVISSSSDGSHDTSRDGEYIAISSTLDDSDGKAIVSPGTELSQRLRPAEFGDAAAEDVAAGKTFTSAAGLKVTGTHECSGGIDTSDATATADDMAKGKTAYVNGQKVTGTVPEITELVKDAPAVEEILVASGAADSYEITKELVSSGSKPSDCSTTKYGSYTVTDDGYFKLSGSAGTLSAYYYLTGQTTNAKSIYYANFSGASTKYYLWTIVESESGESKNYIAVSTKLDETDGKGIVKPTTTICQRVEPSVFGDATAADVATGKTFTSAAGLKVAGTAALGTGTDTSDATAAATDILSGKTAYVNGSKVTGTIQSKGAADLTASGASVSVPAGYYASAVSKAVSTSAQAVPTISVGTDGKITATAEQSAGYVESGTRSATKQLTTQAAQTITPGTADKTIASGKFLTGIQTVKGDANLVAGNIKSGVSIFGVSGSYEGSGGMDTSDATATAEDIANGKTAYVNGQKVTGNVPVQGAIGIDGATVGTVEDKIRLSANFPSKKIMNSGAAVQLRTPKSNFGDAEASDVAAGKTFTSAAGLKVTGTREDSGTLSITSDGEGNVTITASGSAAITSDENGNAAIEGGVS